MNRLRTLSLCLALAAFGGCASKALILTPDPARLARESDAAPKVKAAVGYFIPSAYRRTQIRSRDAGSYYPYRDIELAYRTMLGNVFESVVRVDSLTDTESMRAAGLQYVISPELLTDSTSLGILIGSPATFMAELTSNVRCPNGILLSNPQVVGQSRTTLREAMVDQAAAGRRAMEDALSKMQHALQAVQLDPQATAGICASDPA